MTSLRVAVRTDCFLVMYLGFSARRSSASLLFLLGAKKRGGDTFLPMADALQAHRVGHEAAPLGTPPSYACISRVPTLRGKRFG